MRLKYCFNGQRWRHNMAAVALGEDGQEDINVFYILQYDNWHKSMFTEWDLQLVKWKQENVGKHLVNTPF